MGDLVSLQIIANAYLHHMVRNIVGTLLDVQREADPAGRHGAGAGRAPIGVTPGLPRPPRDCICGGSNIPKDFAIPAPPGEIGLNYASDPVFPIGS